MRDFIAKYADSFSSKDALKLIHNKLKKAINYHLDGEEERSQQCLIDVSNMINDYLAYNRM